VRTPNTFVRSLGVYVPDSVSAEQAVREGWYPEEEAEKFQRIGAAVAGDKRRRWPVRHQEPTASSEGERRLAVAGGLAAFDLQGQAAIAVGGAAPRGAAWC
jgi:hypothetical protein